MEDKAEIITNSSGNVFADLGLENSEELLAKSTLARTIRDIIKHRQLTQAKAAILLGTHQTQISRLNSAEGLNRISIDLLLSWLTKLDRNITLKIRKMPRKQDMGRIQVSV